MQFQTKGRWDSGWLLTKMEEPHHETVIPTARKTSHQDIHWQFTPEVIPLHVNELHTDLSGYQEKKECTSNEVFWTMVLWNITRRARKIGLTTINLATGTRIRMWSQMEPRIPSMSKLLWPVPIPLSQHTNNKHPPINNRLSSHPLIKPMSYLSLRAKISHMSKIIRNKNSLPSKNLWIPSFTIWPVPI